MGGLGVKFQHFPLTLLVVLTTLTLPCERDVFAILISFTCSYSIVINKQAIGSKFNVNLFLFGLCCVKVGVAPR